jgi:uncharacterized protein (DUF302 family)
MAKFPTVVIDIPPKALVWQDDQGKVCLTYNSAKYLFETVYPRHGAPKVPAKNVEDSTKLQDGWAQKATQH